MLKIKIISVGDKMPAWVNEGTTSYLKRIHRNTTVELVQISAKKRGKQVDVKRVLLEEGEAILKQLPTDTRLICLDRKGRAYDSLSFADKIRDWQGEGQSIGFVIGGPEGLNPTVLAQADETWTLSKMTFSHHVARVMLAEQLYRAWSITEGLPYHR
jgi:23S rRNA (pseudouridine1915-N3)-methyltransferase